ncbi:MAG: DNA-binding protein [Solirubrobacteraceae bacterium]
MDELVYQVTGAAATRATPITLAEAGLKEREHLQEWVLKHPEMLGAGLLVLTSECDRWTSARGRERDRLDVLALDTDGHLVVAELKRDAAPETVELQALKYAAYCSRFTPETLVEEYRAWRARHGEILSDADAFARLEAHLGEDVGGLAGAPLGQPRIVLLAGGFTPSTTAVAVWLREMGVDIALRAVSGYQTGGGPVISVAPVYPTPAVEEFTVSPLLAQRKRDDDVRRAARQEPAVRQLIARGILEPGTGLIVLAGGPDAAQFKKWGATADRDRAVWTGTTSRPLRWSGKEADELGATGNFTVTGLIKFLYQQAQAAVPAGAATQLVATADGQTLAELAGTGPGSGVFDWSGLHRLLARIPAGHWATYGDVASVVGTAGQPLGGHVSNCQQCENAWRLLSADGSPSASFRWNDGRTDTAPEVLQGEGVRFADNVADPAQRLTITELRALLATE